MVTQTITVAIRCPYAYFFSPLPVEDRAEWSCPDGEPIASTAAEQVFENGRMIWLQHDDRIYVFFDDGTYQAFEDTWVAGQPDAVPGLTPPAGRYLPVRGFGKVWSGDAGHPFAFGLGIGRRARALRRSCRAAGCAAARA